MTEEIKRMHFFDGLFLTEEEFNLEQSYNLSFRHLHNGWFHGWGIINGLDVKTGSEPKEIIVTKGAAIDRIKNDNEQTIGREIVLVEDTILELAGYTAGDTVFVYIQFAEEEADIVEDKGAETKIHWWEKPEIGHQRSNPIDDKSKITLARVLLEKDATSGNTVFTVQYEDEEQSFRKSAGFSGKLVETEKLVLLTETGAGTMAYLEAKPGDKDIHGIQIQSSRTNISGNLSLEGGLHIGSDKNPAPGSLEVEGKTSLDGNLSVKGDTTVGTSGQSSTLTVKGEIVASGGIANQGNLQVDGTTQLKGNLVTEAEGNLQGNVTIGTDSGTAAMLRVKGPTQIDETLTAQSDVQVGGNATIGGTLTVDSDTELKENLLVVKNLEVGQTLFVDTSATPGMSFTGDMNINKDGDGNGGNLGIAGNCSIDGDLIVKGSTTTINTVDMEVQDNIVLLNKSNSASIPPTLKSGIEVFRGTDATGKNAKLLWHESDQKWKLGINDELEAVVNQHDLAQSLETLENTLMEELLQIGGEGGLASVISMLVDTIAVEKESSRHKALLENPVQEKNSLLTATWGAFLDLVRIAYAMLLEYLDPKDLQNGEIGDNATLHLTGLFKASNIPYFVERIQERINAFKSNDFVTTCYFLFLHDLLIDTPKKAGISFIDTFAEKYNVDTTPPATWNGPAAMAEFLEKIYAPLVKTDQELNHKATKTIQTIVLNCLKNLWQKIMQELLLDTSPSFKFAREDWKKLETEVEKVGEPLVRAFAGCGLVSWWDLPEAIQEVCYQKDLDENDGNTWLLSGSKLIRVSHAHVMKHWQEDIKAKTIPPLLPDISIDFSEPIQGFRVTDTHLFVTLPTDKLYTLPFTSLNRAKIDLTIEGSPFLPQPIKGSALLPSGGDDMEALFFDYNLAASTGSRINVFNGEKNEFTATIDFNLEDVVDPQYWLNGKTPRIFSPPLMIKEGIDFSYVLTIVELPQGQTIFMGISPQSPWWGKKGAIKWFRAIQLHQDVSLLGTALDQLIINQHTQQKWAFIPLLTFLPELWQKENEDLLAAIMTTIMPDGSPLFDIKWYESDKQEIVYKGELQLEFQEGRIFDIYEDLVNGIVSLSDSKNPWVSLYKCFISPVPQPMAKIMTGENQRNSRVAHHVPNKKSETWDFLAVTTKNKTIEYQTATIKK